jgi:glutamyl-tRNA synthetase
VSRLAELREELAQATELDPPEAQAILERFVARREIKLGEIVHALRVAVSGKAVGFGLFDILGLLGRERVLARIDRALALAAARPDPN